MMNRGDGGPHAGAGHEIEPGPHMSSDRPESKLETATETAPTTGDNLASSRAGLDADILQALRDGDRRRALSLCARHHGPALGRLCMALLGSQAEADDAVQETLLAAHASFDGFRGDGSLRAWLYSIARRRCARALERRGAGERPVPSREAAAFGEELLETRRRAERARALLAGIRPTEREALLLRYLGELSFREVGEACGIDEAAARKRVSRALARLREAVEK
jgi:RNA polymerase sigma-70 factor (ECF subfamily)